MGKHKQREPFDPTDPYDAGCEIVRKAVLRSMSNAMQRMPAALVGPDRTFAQINGATMALACIVAASSQPGRELQAMQDIMGLLPQMIADAKDMQEAALARNEDGGRNDG